MYALYLLLYGQEPWSPYQYSILKNRGVSSSRMANCASGVSLRAFLPLLPLGADPVALPLALVFGIFYEMYDQLLLVRKQTRLQLDYPSYCQSPRKLSARDCEGNFPVSSSQHCPNYFAPVILDSSIKVCSTFEINL